MFQLEKLDQRKLYNGVSNNKSKRQEIMLLSYQRQKKNKNSKSLKKVQEMDYISQPKRYFYSKIAQNQTKVNQADHDELFSLRTYPMKVIDLYNYISRT